MHLITLSTDIKLFEAQVSKIIQSGGFLGSLLSKLAVPLMKVAIALAKNVLAPLGIIAAAWGIDAGIQKKIHCSGTTTLIISNKEMNYITKIVQDLEDSNILLKGVSKILKKRMGFLMPPHPFTNFKMQNYYENEPRLKCVYSRNNLPEKIKGWAYVINLDEYADSGTHWIALFCKKEWNCLFQ